MSKKLIMKEKNGVAYFVPKSNSKVVSVILALIIGLCCIFINIKTTKSETEFNPSAFSIMPRKPATQVDISGAMVDWVMKYKVSKPLAEDIVNHAVYQGTQQGVDPKLILALIKVESTFKPHSISGSNALGLMQVILVWHKEKLHDYKVFDTDVNIELGTKVLAEYSKGTSTRNALLKYNGALNAPNDYPDKILNAKQDLENFINSKFTS